MQSAVFLRVSPEHSKNLTIRAFLPSHEWKTCGFALQIWDPHPLSWLVATPPVF